MSATAMVALVIYALVVVLLAYVIVLLLGKAGINGMIAKIVYVIAALIVLVLVLQHFGILLAGERLLGQG
jgi:hypothetical protein